MLVAVAACLGTVSLRAAPTITQQPVKATKFETENHTFTVTATGTAPLTYQWQKSGGNLGGKTNDSLLLTNLQLSDAGIYSVVVSNISGAITSAPAQLTVRGTNDPRYPTPQGGWTYIYQGNAASNSLTASLDGTWNRQNGIDSWDGLGRGAGNGAIGGVEATNGILTLEDANAVGTSGFDNRRFYFTHDINADPPVTNANSLLNDGVTLTFRARLTPPSDPRLELTNAPNGWVNTNDGKGIFGIRQAGASGLLISFSLNRAVEDISTNTTFTFAQQGLHMNNLNGNARTSFVDPGEPGSINLLPLDPALFHEFWITIRDNGTDPGTHTVTIYTDGTQIGTPFNVTAGSGSDQPFTNYLALGMGSTPERGAIDIDFFGYAQGATAPSGFNDPVGFVFQPTNQIVATGQVATFTCGVTGAPPHFFQWFKNGTTIPNATNTTYTTPPTTPSDDGSLFTIVVTNDINRITSSPPAVLTRLFPPTITSQPQSQVVTNGDPATFTVTANSAAPLAHQWRYNSTPLPGETAPTLFIPAATPSHAGNYDVILTNTAGATTSLVATLTVRTLDLGDAPAPAYPTLKANNGARHLIVPSVRLGAAIDLEVDANPNATATGDDLDGLDDEDGVTFTTPLRAGQVATVEVVASTGGFLNAWLDFNANGSWAQPGEQIFTNRSLAAGNNILNILVPPSASAGNTFARFRFNTAGGLSFDGPAADGEVEDYMVSVAPVADLVVFQSDAPDPVGVGSNLTYTVTVSNAGPSAATAVLFTNVLPAGVTFGSVTPSQGGCTPSGGTVTCSLGVLASGASATVAIAVTPTAVASLTNRASAFSTEFDVAASNNTSTEVTTALNPPHVTTPPQSLTVTNGNPATFTVVATGSAPLSYQWRLAGTNLLDKTNSTLTIASAQPADAGDYSVRVSNAVGAEVSPSATLTVLVPPAITAQPQSRTNLAGSTATFSVTATGSAPLAYQWFFQGSTALPGATNATLVLTNVLTNNAGAYQVRVTNSAGLVTSSSASLTVLEMDFGDAPDPSFPVLLANNGARHRIAPGVRLGSLLDFEPDGQPGAAATGDNLNGQADEDGVSFLTPVRVGQSASVSVVASTNGVLSAWLDFNRNGSWAEAGEQIFTNVVLVAGANALQFVVPASAVSGNSYARFRFSTVGGLSFVGEAANGEVEDYAVAVGAVAELSLGNVGPAGALTVGSNATYVLRVTNAGPSTATAVSVVDVLPAGLSFVSAVPSQGGCSHSSGTVTCGLGTVASNGTALITLVANVTAAGAFTNTATVSAAEADNNLANNTASSVVQAYVFPQVVTPPASQTVTNGNPVTLSVTANGTALRYQWQLEGNPLSGATNAALAILSAQTNNAGVYRVRITNEVGNILSPPATLTVLVPATIVTNPQNTNVVAGQTAVLSVVAIGTEPLSYQWQFEGVDIPGANSANLTLPNAQPSQSGSYRVRVSNVVRTVMSVPALLSVYVQPVIVTQPQSRTNFAGSDTTFVASATGTEPLSYQWYFNAATPLAGQTAPTLTLTNLQPSHSGGYSLIVTNPGGSATSIVAQLQVIEADFGDAPEANGYPTLSLSDGAWHRILPGIRLGSAIDREPEGQPSATARGDDLNGTDDEDGVAFTSQLLQGGTATVAVTASTNGFLDAWVDFSANGSWMDMNEQIFSSRALTAGVNLLTFNVPASAVSTNTFARFRFSTAGGLSFEGPATDGEVEDYEVTILPAFDLALMLTENPDPVLVTSNVLFTMTITNRGAVPVGGVMLTNTLPPGMTLLSINRSQGACTNEAGRVVCSLGTLSANAGAVVTVGLRADQAGVVASSALVTAPGNDVNLANNVATQLTAVVVAPAAFGSMEAITVADASGSGPGVGSPYPSTITVSGLTGTVYKVTVTLSNVSHTFPGDFDILLVGPSGQSVILMSDAGGGIDMADVTVSFDDGAEASLPNAGVINSIAYRPTDIDPELDSDVFPAPAPAGPYGGALAVFNGSNPNGVWSLFVVDDLSSDVGFVTGGWGLNISTADPFADLAVGVAESADPVGLLSNLTYSVSLSNLGPAAVAGVRLVDTISPGTLFVGATVPGGACTNVAGGVVRCDVANIDPGAVAVVTIVVQAASSVIVTNRAQVSGDRLDLVAANNSAEITTRILPVNNLVLSMAASTNQVVLDTSVAYFLTVTNLGPVGATRVMLTNPLPNGVNFVSASATGGSCTNTGSMVVCDFGNVAAGAGGTAQIVVMTTTASVGLLTNSAVVAGGEVDSAAQNNSAQVVTPVNTSANLSLGASRSPNPVAATSNLTCVVVMTNNGPQGANGVRLVAPLPAGVVYVSGVGPQGACTNDAGTVRCGIGNLTPGLPRTATFVFAPMVLGPLTNRFILESDSFDYTPADNSIAVVTAVEQAPIVTAGPQSLTVVSGTNVTFSVSASGFAPLSFQWQFNGTDMTGATNSSLSLLAVAPAQQGNYRALVRNPVGATASTAAVLRVLVPPTISDVADQTVDEDNSTALLPFTIGDFETPASALSLTVSCSNTQLVPLANIFLSGSDGNRFVQVFPATNRFGQAQISIRVKDEHDLVATDSFLLTVLPMNDPPVLLGATNQSTGEDIAIAISLTIADAENDPSELRIEAISFNTTLVPQSALTLSGTSSNRVLTILPATNLFGAAPISVSVTDTNGLVTSNTFVLTVNSVNDPPTLNTIPDRMVNANSGLATVQLAGITAGANESQSLTVTAMSSDLNRLPTPTVIYQSPNSTGSLTFTPVPNASGSATITVTVMDDGASNNVTSRSFTVDIVEVILPPVISDIPDRSSPEDTPVVIPFTVSNHETAAENLIVTASSSNPGLLPNSAILLGGPGSNRTATLTPLLNQTGSVTVTFIVTDAYGLSATDSFVLTVTNVNDFPTLSGLPDLRTDEDVPTGPLSITVGDVETALGSLSLVPSSSNAGLVPSGNITFGGTGANRTVTVTPAANQSGIATITVTLNDGSGGSTNISFVLTVAAVNDPPTLAAIPNQAVSRGAGTQTVALSGISPGPNESQTLSLSAISSNPSLIPNPAISYTNGNSTAVLSYTPVAMATGAVVVTVTVNDGGATNSTTTRTFNITVNPANDPPTISGIGPQSMLEDGVLTVPFTIGDPETAALSLLVTATSTNPAVLPATNIFISGPTSNRTVTLVPLPNQFGTSLVSVAVSDGIASNATSFLVSVIAVNDQPTLDALTNVNVAISPGAMSVPLTGISAGPANETESLSIIVTNNAPGTFWANPAPAVAYSGGSTGVLNFRPSNNQSGSYSLGVVVNDLRNSNNVFARSFQLNVRPSANVPPTLSIITNQTIPEDTVLGPINFTVRDAETFAPSLVVTAQSTNEALIPNSNIVLIGNDTNRSITLTPLPNRSGVTLIRLTARDINSGGSNMSFTVTVNPVNDPPTLTGIGPQSTLEDTPTQPILFNISDMETPPGSLALTATSGNPTLVPNGNIVLGGSGTNRALVITPAENQSGSALVTVTVSDGSLSTNTTFTLNVGTVEDPPTLSAIADQTTPQNIPTAPIPFTIADPDTPLANLTLRSASSNTNLIPTNNIVFGGSGGSRSVTLTPLANQTGTAAITVILGDSTSSVSNTFQLTVTTTANESPTLNPISNLTLNENAPVQTVPLANITSGSPAETQTLIVAASSSNPGLIPHPTVNYTSPANSGTLTFLPIPNSSGSATVTVTVNDGQVVNNILTRTFTVTVNGAPLISSVPNQVMNENSVLGPIPFTVSDPESPANSLALSRSSSNTGLVPTAGIALGGSGGSRTVTITPVIGQYGSTFITLTAADPNGNTALSAFLVTVRPLSHLPQIVISNNQTTMEDTPVAIPITVNDLEDDPSMLNLEAFSTNLTLFPPSMMTFGGSGSNRVLTVVPGTNQFGASTITVKVTDTSGGTSSNTFVLNVASVNDPPTFNPVADLDIDEDAGLLSIEMTGLSGGPLNEPQNLIITAESSDTSIIPTPVVVYSPSSSNGLLRLLPQPNKNGDVGITVRLNDGGASNNVLVRTFNVHVHPGNDPPFISDIPGQSVPEDTLHIVNFTIGDVETALSNLVLTVSSSNTNLVPMANITLSQTGAVRQLRLLPATNQSGSATITLTVSDGQGGSAGDSFLFVVNPVNDAPTLAAITNVTVLENTGPHTVQLNGIGSGAPNETQTLVLSVESSDPAFVLPVVNYAQGGPTGSLSFTPAHGGTGVVSIMVTVDDGALLNHSVSRSFTIEVLPVDSPPSIGGIANATTREDEPITVPFNVDDAETPLPSLLITASSSNTNLVPQAGLSMSGSGAVRLLQLIPATNASGSATITVSVTDTNGGSASTSFVLTVQSVNDAPVVIAPASVATREDTPSALAAITIQDVDSDAGTVLLVGTSSNPSLVPNSGISFSSTGANRTLQVTPAPDQSGTAVISFTATDAGGAVSTGSISVVVAPVNDPPTLGPINDVTVNEDSGTGTVPLSGISAGPANELQFLEISAVSDNPALVSALSVAYVHPQTTGMLSFVTAPDAFGTATVMVTANDGQPSNNIVLRTFTVTVRSIDDPPVLSAIENQSTPEDTARVIAFAVSDDTTPVGDVVLARSSSNTNVVPTANITFGGSGSNRTVTLLPATNQSGSSTITITATDTNNNSASRVFVLTVNPVNEPPTITDIPDQSVNEDTNGLTVNFTIGDLETPEASLVVSVSSSNPLLIPSANLLLGGSGANRSLLLTPLANAAGNSTISVVVHDEGGLTAMDTFVVMVQQVNDPPGITDVSNVTMAQGGTLGLPFVVTDRETAASNLLVTASSSNTNLVAASGLAIIGPGASRVLTITPLPGQSGTANITLTVQDGSGAGAVDSFVLTVQAAQPEIPVITVHPQSQSVVVGGTANLSVSATGTAPLVYQWQLAGTNLPSATNAILTISNAQAANAGNYLVVVSNIAGSVTSLVATLTVQQAGQPPTISGLTGPLSTDEDTVLVRSFNVSDPDTLPFQLILSATSTNSALVAATNIFFDGNGTNRTLLVKPSPDQFGVTLLTVAVSDGASSRSNSFVLTVNAVNDPPTLNPLPDILLLGNGNPPAQTVSLSGISSGATNETQSLNITVSSSNPSVIPTPSVSYTNPLTTGTITFDSAQNNLTGSSVITVNVTDNGSSNNTVSRSFTVVYRDNANTPPTITPIANQTNNEDTVTGPISFTVADATTPAASLALRHFSSNPALIPTNNIVFGGSGSSRTVTLAPLANQSGSANITIEVFDGALAFASASFTFTVNPVNDPPTMTGILNQSIADDMSTGVLPFAVSDVETPADRLTVTASSSDTSLVPLSNIVLGGNGTNRALIVTPAGHRSGSAIITLTVTDGSGGSTNTSFTVTVAAPNRPPVVSAIGPQSIDEDASTGPLALSVGDDLTLAGSLSLTATSSNTTLVPAGNVLLGGGGSNRTVTVTPTANLSGSSLITINVTDGNDATTSVSFVVTVNPVNDLPTLSPIADVALSAPGVPREVALSGIGSGAANESQLLVVTASSSNPALVPDPVVNYTSPNSTGTLTLTPLAAGSATITVTVNDGGPQNPLFSRTFSLSVGGPPTISAVTDQVTDEDTPTGAISVTLADETSTTNLSFTASSSNTNLLPGANIALGGTGPNRTVTLTPATNQSGVSIVTLTAVDSDTNTTSHSFVLIVNPVNDRPTLDPLASFSVPKGAGLQVVPLTGIGSGATNEAQTPTVSAISSDVRLLPTPTVNYTSPSASGSLSFMPVPNASGTATVSVVVSDGQSLNGSITQSFTVTILATNDPPTISNIPDQSTAEDSPLQIGFLVDDLETVAAALTLTASSSDPSLVPVGNIVFGGAGRNRAAIITPAANRSGSVTIAITVTDAGGATANDSFVFTVNGLNDPPVISHINDRTIAEDTSTGPIGFVVDDLETAAGALTVSVSTSDPVLTPTNGITFGGSGGDRTITLTPAADRFGSATITITVKDEAGATASDRFVLTVNPVNDPPRLLTALPDRTIDENTSTPTVGFVIGDLETPAANLNVSASSSNPALVPNGAVVFGGSDSNRTLVVTPEPNRFGTATITVTVTDASGSSTNDIFVVTVNPITDPPVIVTDPIGQTVVPGSTVLLRVTALGTAPLAYQWQKDGFDVPGGTNATLTLSGVTGSNAGNYRARVSNTAGSATSAAARVRVLVAPVITSIRRNGPVAEISFKTEAGLLYSVELKDGVGEVLWMALPGVNGTGGVLTVVDPSGLRPLRIYRVRVD